MPETIAIGIDFGHTNLVMARMDRRQMRVLDNQDAEPITPAVVHITKNGELVIGKQARSYAGSDPENTVFSILSFLGRDFSDPALQGEIKASPNKLVELPNGETGFVIHGRTYTAVEIASYLFASLKADAAIVTEKQVTQAVLAIPHHFGNRQRKACREAVEASGLENYRIVPHDHAAVLACQDDKGFNTPRNIVLYNFGGKEFQASVVNYNSGAYITLASNGDAHLGGADLDNEIVNWIVNKLRREQGIDLLALPDQAEILFRLRTKAEEAKVRLGRAKKTAILIPGITKVQGKPVDIEAELTREEYHQMVEPYLIRSMDITLGVIHQAGISLDEVGQVMMVGGTSKSLPMEARLAAVFGDRVGRNGMNPMHCIAQGAALMTQLPPAVDEPAPQPEKVAKPAPVPQPVAAPPARVEQELSTGAIQCECGVNNPPGRNTCCFCGQPLPGFEPVEIPRPPKKKSTPILGEPPAAELDEPPPDKSVREGTILHDEEPADKGKTILHPAPDKTEGTIIHEGPVKPNDELTALTGVRSGDATQIHGALYLPVPVGIEGYDRKMIVIAREGSTYPTKSVQVPFQTSEPNQRRLEIPVYEGRKKIAAENDFLGMAVVYLPDGVRVNASVNVFFALDQQGVVVITAELQSRPDIALNTEMRWKQD